MSNRPEGVDDAITSFSKSSKALESWVEHLIQENERLRAWIDDLQSGMYINCVYCGHRYGPDDEVASTMAQALYNHVKECDKHPLAAANRKIEELVSQMSHSSI